MPASPALSSNFAHLREHDEQLLRLGMLAERYFADAPNTCLLKLRQFAELLARITASSVGVLDCPEEGQYELLLRFRDHGILPPEIHQIFGEIRRTGNTANHAFAGDHRSALATLKIAWQLGVWFHRTFAKADFKSGPFIPPRPPADESAELRAELAAQSKPSHRALADARTTTEILIEVARRLKPGAATRKEIVARHGRHFLPIARQLASWREASTTQRPATLCQQILTESGLLEYYRADPQRIANLQRFIAFFHAHDDPTRPPDDILAELTRKVALSRNLDFLALDDGAIPILTVHQSKGLEFDTVIIAGMTDDEHLSYDQIYLPGPQFSTNHLDS